METHAVGVMFLREFEECKDAPFVGSEAARLPRRAGLRQLEVPLVELAFDHDRVNVRFATD